MAVKLYEAPVENNWETTLDGAINDSVSTISLASTTNLVAPGVLVIDRTNAAGTAATPANREFITFTGISSNDITGVTRSVAGSTAQQHSSGARVEASISVTHWIDMIDFLEVEHLSDGTHDLFSHARQITVTGVSGASGIRGDVVFTPGANVSIYAVSGASGYSHITFAVTEVAAAGGLPPFTLAGTIFTGTRVTPDMLIEDSSTISSASAVLHSPVSGASLVIDLNLNDTSIFTNQATRLSILGGGTYASTASIGTTALTPGNRLTMDIDNAGGGVLTVLVET